MLTKKYADATNREHVLEQRNKAVAKITEAYKGMATVVKQQFVSGGSVDGLKSTLDGTKASIQGILATISSDAISKDNVLVGLLSIARALFRSPLEENKQLGGMLLTAVSENLPEKSKSSVVADDSRRSCAMPWQATSRSSPPSFGTPRSPAV